MTISGDAGAGNCQVSFVLDLSLGIVMDCGAVLKSRLCRVEMPIFIGRLGAASVFGWEHLIYGITLFRKGSGCGHEVEWQDVEVFGLRLSTDCQQVHQGPGSMLEASECACCSGEPGWFRKALRIRGSSYSGYA